MIIGEIGNQARQLGSHGAEASAVEPKYLWFNPRPCPFRCGRASCGDSLPWLPRAPYRSPHSAPARTLVDPNIVSRAEADIPRQWGPFEPRHVNSTQDGMPRWPIGKHPLKFTLQYRAEISGPYMRHGARPCPRPYIGMKSSIGT